MTTTYSTATAAHIASVTTRTVRRWAANGKVAATKNTAGHWVIDAVSLYSHIAASIADRADYSAYAASGKAKARENVYNLVADGAIVPLIPGCYLVVSKTTDGITYIVSTGDQAGCDCRSFEKRQYCTHLTAARAIEASKPHAAQLLDLAA